MKNKRLHFAITLCLIGINTIAQELYKAPSSQTKTVWVSPENPTGAKGSAGITNKGAKGRAFITLEAGQKIDVLNGFTIPTLEEVLDLINGRVFLNIELKGTQTALITDEIIKLYCILGLTGLRHILSTLTDF